MSETKNRHTISVLVDNESGVLSRVLGVFTSRGYNVESLTVGEVDIQKNLSRITIVTNASLKAIGQIITLLERLVPVHRVLDLTSAKKHLEREVSLVKISYKQELAEKTLKLAKSFGAKLVDKVDDIHIFEICENPTKIDEFLKEIRANKKLKILEMARGGVTAIASGEDIL
ncbi:MAG: acetolactate synthase small subunit [Alphaproteobacteria bacterium]|jgi:acetolactate synthase-1/3 small subunit